MHDTRRPHPYNLLPTITTLFVQHEPMAQTSTAATSTSLSPAYDPQRPLPPNQPRTLAWFTDAPSSTRARTTSTWPLRLAASSGVAAFENRGDLKSVVDSATGLELEFVDAKTEALMTASQKLGEKVYADMQAAQAAGGAAAGPEAKPADDNVVDAEVKEVKKG